jgi:hypothetical protein
MKKLFLLALVAVVALSAWSQAQEEQNSTSKGPAAAEGSALLDTSSLVLPSELRDADGAKTSPLLFDSPDPSSFSGASSAVGVADSSISPTVASNTVIVQNPEPSPRVRWGHLITGSLVGLTFMNAYRIGTEPSTREGLHNSVVGGYFDALGDMHGWSDGDGYYENYLGHPIGGATSGYLWIHNDPRYNRVEFGKDRDYWMSRLRAYAFAWAFSEQFEVGLISEASVGQIQRSCCAYGFVDHVITPNGGMVWLLTGDILDKYVTRRIEDRYQNQWVRSAARVALNFPEAFANVFSFKVPWYRDNRPGVREYDGQLYPAFRPAISRAEGDYPVVPSFELTAAVPSYLQMGKNSCVGGGGIGAFRVAEQWQWTIEVSGCSIVNFPKQWSGDSLTFTTGPQWILHTSSRWTPYAHVRFGGQKVTEEYIDPELLAQAKAGLPPNGNLKSVHDLYALDFESTGVSMAIGGGVDIGLNRAMALRLASVDYVRSWLGTINGDDFNRGFRISTGLVLRVGTW